MNVMGNDVFSPQRRKAVNFFFGNTFIYPNAML